MEPDTNTNTEDTMNTKTPTIQEMAAQVEEWFEDRCSAYDVVIGVTEAMGIPVHTDDEEPLSDQLFEWMNNNLDADTCEKIVQFVITNATAAREARVAK